jgi:shikimate dehydrogenase
MLSPQRDALTYTFLEGDEAAAPGQVPIHILKSAEHVHSPELYGVLGGLEVKSGSPLIHNALAKAHNLDKLYTTFLTDELADAWDFIVSKDVQGLSVTTPWKREVIPLLDSLDPVAEKLQSVNTIVKIDGKLRGYNMDHVGMENGYDFFREGQTVAIIGSGGVVPAVIEACRQKGIEDITIYARNTDARSALAERFTVSHAPLEEAESSQPDVLINAITNDIPLPIPAAKTGANALDLRYGRDTIFLQEAGEKGYEIHDGTAMLIHQALGQFRLFTGLEPGNEDLQLLKNLLKNQE